MEPEPIVIHNSDEDGVTHINVYSQGRTELGRMLSNFAYSPITTADGDFASIEGYWYWLSTEEATPGREQLRELSGFDAKKRGRKLQSPDFVPDLWSRRKIRLAIWLKIQANLSLRNRLAQSVLPFAHYYVYGGEAHEAGWEWIIDYIERCRRIL